VICQQEIPLASQRVADADAGDRKGAMKGASTVAWKTSSIFEEGNLAGVLTRARVWKSGLDRTWSGI
jgi:hypothetical protein